MKRFEVEDDSDNSLEFFEDGNAEISTTCEPCNNTFSSPEKLKQHMKDIHDVGMKTVDKWICDCCGKRYATNFTLKRHRRTKHKSIPELSSPKPISCSKCSAKFTAKKALIKHLSVIHRTETPKRKLYKPVDMNFTCYRCNKRFSSNHSVRRHLIKVHKMPKSSESGNFICPICKTNWNSAKTLNGHLLSKHNIQQEEEDLIFESREEFYAWKKQIEVGTKTRYSQSSGKRRLLGGLRIYYNCFRSGMSLMKGNGTRTMQKESIKMNATCPSRMVVTLIKDEPIKVQFSKVHVGHNLESSFTRTVLPEEEVEIRIQQEEEDVESKSSNSTPSLKDPAETIHVIEEFDFGTSKWIASDATDVEDTIEVANESGEYTSVIYYKAENTEGDGLNSSEFLIVIMTKDQEEVLLNYKDGRVAIDTSRGITDFQVTTLLTLDERSTGCPMAFCISNRNDELAMSIFFEVVKMRVGVIEANIFMSDGEPEVYMAWEKTMCPSKHLLLSLWHVDSDWRKKCREMTLNTVKAIEIYRGCRVLLETTELDEFDILLKTFLSTCASDPEMREFGEYFSQKYGSCPEKWSSAHRIRVGLHTDSYLEALFKKLRYCYPDGKKYRTVEEIMHVLNNLSQDLIFERMVCGIKQKSEEDIIIERHEMGNEISKAKIDVLSPYEWEVHCSLLKEPYKVVFDTESQCEDCSLLCHACGICVHQATCTCNDYLLDSVFCEHIHACLSLKGSQQHLSECSKSQVAPNQFQNAIKRLEELAKQVPPKCLPEAWASTEQLTNLIQTLIKSSH